MAEKFDGHFECLGKDTEKYITFLVPIKKENENGKAVTYEIKFIDSVRSVASLLSSLPDNLSERLHKGKWKDSKSCPEYATVNDISLVFKYIGCSKNYEEEFDEDLAKRFENTFRCITGRCIWKLPQKMHWNIWTWFCLLLPSTKISMVSMSEEDRGRIETTDRCWYATNCRERYQGWNFSHDLSTRESK